MVSSQICPWHIRSESSSQEELGLNETSQEPLSWLELNQFPLPRPRNFSHPNNYLNTNDRFGASIGSIQAADACIGPRERIWGGNKKASEPEIPCGTPPSIYESDGWNDDSDDGQWDLNERKLHDFFQECAPTDERLKELGKRWLNPELLRRRLLYCGPFTITFEQSSPVTRSGLRLFWFWSRGGQDIPSGKLVRKTHHELFELLQDEDWERFSGQLSRAWPKTFGSLITGKRRSPFFLWQRNAPPLGDGTRYICRQPVSSGPQPRLKALFHGSRVDLHPHEDVLW